MRKFLLRLIAFAEIAGSLAAFTTFAVELVQSIRAISRAAVDPQIAAIASKGVFALCLIVLVVLTVTGLNFVGGILLWKLRPRGLKLSAWAQAVQIPQIVSSALSYKFVLGPAIIVFLQTQSGFGGSTQEITLETVVGSGDTAPTTIGINLLALATLIYLWRLLRRTDVDAATIPLAPDPNRRSLPVRILRFALKTSAVLATVVMVPVLAWWVWNRIDEAPTPQAKHWFAPLPHTAPDAENAWLYLLGIGAAESEDPIALGRRIVEAHNAREAKLPREAPDAAEKSLRKGALPYVSKSADGRQIETICSFAYRDCVQWAQDASGDLDELARANAVRLKRIETAFKMPRFEDFATPASESPFPEFDQPLYRALILRDLAIPAQRTAALARFERAIDFWRRVDEQANDEGEKYIAETFLNGYIDVLDAGIDHAGTAILGDPTYLDAIDLALRPPSAAQREFELPLRRSARRFAHEMDVAFPGTANLLRYCTHSCFSYWLMSQLFVPQATANLEALFRDAQDEVLRANGRELDQVVQRYRELEERNAPISDDLGQMMRAYVYNLTGRVVVMRRELPDIEYAYRLHDYEGHRRLLRIKIAAMRQHIAPKEMSAFLAAQPDHLRNPYTGEPFEWNASFSELRSTAKSKREKPYVAVSYPAMVTPIVAACADPVKIVVRVGAQNAKQAAAEQAKSGDAPLGETSLTSCAAGMRNATPGLSRLAPDERRVLPEVRTVTIAREGEKLDVRLVLVDSKGNWRGFETLGVPPGQRTIVPPRGDSDLQVEIEAQSLNRSGLFRIDARVVSARQLAVELAKAGRIKLGKPNAWCETPVALQAEGMTAPDLLELLAKTSGDIPKDNLPSSCQ